MQSYSMKCLCKAISCSVKINKLIPGSSREDPAEPVSFDLFFWGSFTKRSGFIGKTVPVSEAALVWKVLWQACWVHG